MHPNQGNSKKGSIFLPGGDRAFLNADLNKWYEHGSFNQKPEECGKYGVKNKVVDIGFLNAVLSRHHISTLQDGAKPRGCKNKKVKVRCNGTKVYVALFALLCFC